MEKVVSQTGKVISGSRSSPGRVVSIFGRGVRPIRRGKGRASIELGRKLFLGEPEQKHIVGSKVLEGSPADNQGAVAMAQKVPGILDTSLKEFAVDRDFLLEGQ